MKKILLGLFLSVIFLPVFFLAYLGLIPGLSGIFGWDKPRDLGIKYTAADLQSSRGKSRIKYETLPANLPPAQSRQFSGRRPVATEFTSAEITATMNNIPWGHYPFRNIQVKFNADGSGEISGMLLKDKVPAYALVIGIPGEAVDFAMKFLPANPVFYVKGKAALTNNQVSLFEPQEFQIGRLSLPVGMFLSANNRFLVNEVYAQDIGSMVGKLSKVQNKKALIIGYINGRLSSAFGDFYAKKAYFGENKLYFDGTLTEKVAYSP